MLLSRFVIIFHNQYSWINVQKKILKKKHLEWRVDITSWFILTIPESNWCYGWFGKWFLRYIWYRSIVALNDMFVIKVSNIIDELIFFFSISASPISIDKIPDMFFRNFSFSIKWCKRNVFFVSVFFLFHIKYCRDPLYKLIVSS